jgi:hypothetical protein
LLEKLQLCFKLIIFSVRSDPFLGFSTHLLETLAREIKGYITTEKPQLPSAISVSKLELSGIEGSHFAIRRLGNTT